VALWRKEQQCALGILEHRLSDNTSKLLKDKKVETLDKAFDKLKKVYQLKGSANFEKIYNIYQGITLAQCKTITNFANKLHKAFEDLKALDTDVELSEHFLVLKFLTGLGPAFNHFQSTFNQNNTLLAKRDENNNITRASVTLSEAIDTAKNEELNQLNKRNNAVPAETTTTLLSRTTTNNGVALTPCTTCGRYFHDTSTCFKTHPKLRKVHIEKKKK